MSACNGFLNRLYVKSFGGFFTLCDLSVISPLKNQYCLMYYYQLCLYVAIDALSLIFLLRINTNLLSDSESELAGVGGGCGGL